MLNQKKVEIFLAKFRKSLAKQFLEIAIYYIYVGDINPSSKFAVRNMLRKSAVW